MIKLLDKYINSDFIKDLQRVAKFGETIHKTNLYKIRENKFKDLKSPVFFLSTGRCGTAWLSDLMKMDKSLMIVHAPENPLLSQSKLFYELYQDGGLSDREWRIFQELYLGAFEHLFFNCIKSGKRLVITESRCSFFAPIIAKLIPQANFVHVYRHPGEFVRSGIRRGYYVKEDHTQLNKIEPLVDDKVKINWAQFNQIQKISWLWNETNSFIESSKIHIDNSKFHTLNFNHWNEEILSGLFAKLNIAVPKESIEKKLNVKINVENRGNVDLYENWSEEDKNSLRELCMSLADKYKYDL
jgi:hypothetical protein